MTSNREFQEHLQAGKLSDAISLLISQLVEIDITTELASPEPSPTTTKLRTQISLLTGQSTTTISPDLVHHESYPKLLDFHTAQIVATNETVQGHLQSLQALLPFLDKTAPTPTAPITATIQPKIKATIAVNKTTDCPIQPIVPPPTATETTPPISIAATPAIISPGEPIEPPPLNVTVTPIPTASSIQPFESPPIESAPVVTSPVTPIESIDPPTSDSLSSVAQPVIPAPSAMPPSKQAEAPQNNLPTVTAGIIASGMAATVAQAGSPQLDEADSIPNKFDQVLKSVGIQDDADDNPFLAAPPPPSGSLLQSSTPVRDDIDVAQLLSESDEEWDEWLLEEDAILSELSQASQEATKEKIPDWDEKWFAQPASGALGQNPSTAEDWEQFIPEYTDLDVPANKGQVNVERFRQNLVNDPKLMNELLAELDDIERLSKEDHPKS